MSIFCVLIALCFVSLSTSKFTCPDCINFWNGLRRSVGCNNQTNSVCLVVEELFFVSQAVCQRSIDAICRKGCESDPNKCAFVACGLLKYCNSTHRDVLAAKGLDSHGIVYPQLSKLNSRDQTNSLEEDSNLDDLEDDDADEIEMDETKPEKAEETNVVTKDMAKEVQEQEPRLVLFVVHEEVHDVVFVEVSLMQHLKNILSRMRKETCSFFARLFSRRNPPAQIEETQNSRVYETSIDSEVESHQLPRLHAQTNERKENHHVDPSFDHTQNH